MKLSESFNEALVYAANLHANQMRKGNDSIPYITHLMAVASITLEYGGNETQAIAALLHDAVEDQGGSVQLTIIQNKFGEAVAQIVADCSDAFDEPKPPWQQRKEDYIKHLAHVSADSLLVSCADKLHNSRTVLKDYRQKGEAVWEHFKGRRDGTLWYYHSITRTFQSVFKHPITDELTRVVHELESLTGYQGE
ncbi:MAG: HD domain-containing protein [Anaerolineae bacterium]|nr:HD domain-containing protein [Anaerolineae bacterium]